MQEYDQNEMSLSASCGNPGNSPVNETGANPNTSLVFVGRGERFSAGDEDDLLSAEEKLQHDISALRHAEKMPIEEKRLNMARCIFGYLVLMGAKMYGTPTGSSFIAIGGEAIRLDKKDPKLWVFLQSRAGIVISTGEGRAVLQALKSLVLERGDKLEEHPGMLHTVAETGDIFLNLNNDRQEIARLYPGGVETMVNGCNRFGVMLAEPTIRPVRYLPGVDVSAGMAQLKLLAYQNIPCAPPERLFVLGWGAASLLTGTMSNRILLKFSGPTGGGKSTVATLITKLVNGQTDPETSRLIKDLTITARSSLILLLENLEQRDMTMGLRRFLLCISTGLRLTTRKLYTDLQQVISQPRCFTCVTAIEPFFDLELLNRSFDVLVDRAKYGTADFRHTEVLAAIEESRDTILSAIFKVIAHEILPTLSERKREILEYLDRRHPGHFTDRSNEAIAVIALCAERFQFYFDGSSDIFSLIDNWVGAQDVRGRFLVAETNPLVMIFGKLASIVATVHGGGVHECYGLGIFCRNLPEGGRSFVFECSSTELLSLIAAISRECGYTQPFKNAGCLSARLKNSQAALAEIGWGVRMTVRTVRGTGIHRFTLNVPENFTAGPQEPDREEEAGA